MTGGICPAVTAPVPVWANDWEGSSFVRREVRGQLGAGPPSGLSAVVDPGLPTAWSRSFSTPGFSSSAALRIEPPESTSKIAATIATASTDWRAVKCRTPAVEAAHFTVV